MNCGWELRARRKDWEGSWPRAIDWVALGSGSRRVDSLEVVEEREGEGEEPRSGAMVGRDRNREGKQGERWKKETRWKKRSR